VKNRAGAYGGERRTPLWVLPEEKKIEKGGKFCGGETISVQSSEEIFVHSPEVGKKGGGGLGLGERKKKASLPKIPQKSIGKKERNPAIPLTRNGKKRRENFDKTAFSMSEVRKNSGQKNRAQGGRRNRHAPEKGHSNLAMGGGAEKKKGVSGSNLAKDQERGDSKTPIFRQTPKSFRRKVQKLDKRGKTPPLKNTL